MEEVLNRYLVDTLLGFWQFYIVCLLVVVGWIINLFDTTIGKKTEYFTYEEMPHLQPVRIPTKEKGFWGAVWMWLTTTRNWEIAKDFHYTIDGTAYVIPKGFRFDGASIPKFLSTWLSPVGVLLLGGLIHDYGYRYQTLLCQNKKDTLGLLTQREIDVIFREINISVNGFVVLNYVAYYALRLGGFIAWNRHRNNNLPIPELK